MVPRWVGERPRGLTRGCILWVSSCLVCSGSFLVWSEPSLPGTFACSSQGPRFLVWVLPLPSQTLLFSLYLPDSRWIRQWWVYNHRFWGPLTLSTVPSPFGAPPLPLGGGGVSSCMAWGKRGIQNSSPLPWPLSPGADGQGQWGRGILGRWDCLGENWAFSARHMASCALDLSICSPSPPSLWQPLSHQATPHPAPRFQNNASFLPPRLLISQLLGSFWQIG